MSTTAGVVAPTATRNLPAPDVLNISVLRGTVHRPPQWRELRSGASVTNIDVKVHVDDGRPEVLRVSWVDAPSSALDFDEGDDVIVVGRVRTYWSGRRSETDVLAKVVLRSRATTRVRRSLAESMAALQAACP